MSSAPLIAVKLTAAEILLLDGKTRPEVQTLVDQARRQIEIEGAGADPRIAALVSEALREATEKRKLVYRGVSITFCRVCDRDEGYHPYHRSGRKGGVYRRRGEPDRSNPVSFGAIELRDSGVRISGYVSLGCCDRCWVKAAPLLREALRGVCADLPQELTGQPRRWRLVDEMKCSKCEWTGPETDMRPSLTFMGDGYFPSGCPACDARNELFTSPIKRSGGTVLIDLPAARRALLADVLKKTEDREPHRWSVGEFVGRAKIQLGEVPEVVRKISRTFDLNPESGAALRAEVSHELAAAPAA